MPGVMLNVPVGAAGVPPHVQVRGPVGPDPALPGRPGPPGTAEVGAQGHVGERPRPPGRAGRGRGAGGPGVRTAAEGVVEVERRIAARPETVFSYLTDPERFRRWQGID